MTEFWTIPLAVFALIQSATIATSVYLHRALAHRSLAVHPVAGVLLRTVLWLTTGQDRREWVAVHRKHHAFTDRDGDPHSPRLHGFWHVQFLNVYYYVREARNPQTIERFAPDILPDRLERALFSRGWVGLGLGTTLLCLILGLGMGLLVALAHAILYVFVLAPLINGLGHWRGAQNFDNTAHNSRVLAWWTGGESLHNNHHAYPRSPKFSVRRIEFDPSWLVIRALAAVRLVVITGTLATLAAPASPGRASDHPDSAGPHPRVLEAGGSAVKADHPRAIDRYIDYFGNGAGTRSEALDTRMRPVHEPPGVERSDLGARDESPRP